MNFNFEELTKLLRERAFSGKALIFCHHNADPDSVCSAYAFKEFTGILNPLLESEIILTGGASSVSRQVIDTIGIETVTDAVLEEAEILIILDVGTIRQLENWMEKVVHSDVPKIFIDHHTPDPEIIRLATLYILMEEATSTCEIVYGLFKAFGIVPSASVAKALLAGIAFDSKHFKIGTSESYKTVSELLEIDGSV